MKAKTACIKTTYADAPVRIEATRITDDGIQVLVFLEDVPVGRFKAHTVQDWWLEEPSKTAGEDF